MEVKLGKKRHTNGKISLYIEYNLEGIHRKEDIHLTLDHPDCEYIRKRNEDRLLLARQICAKREWEIIANFNRVELPYPHLLPFDFLDLFGDFTRNYKGKDINTVKATERQLHQFADEKSIPLKMIDATFCRKFYSFLKEHLRGNTPAGYFKKFSLCLNKCVEDHLITSNPAKEVKLISNNEFTKNILNSEEMQRIASLHYTSLHYREVWRAFLFACNTGLRWCDIYALRFSSVDIENGMLNLIQQKVKNHSSKAVLHLNLNKNALFLLKIYIGKPNEKVFQLPTYNYALRLLERIVKDAGIDKHITFHCGRHSFITELIVYGADIKTAAELAGHSSIRHTEKYVHLVDRLKQKAVDSLPALIIKDF